MSVTVLPGDMLERLAEMEPASLDACVTDPPYGLAFMGKGWDHAVPGVDYWRAVYRVLKPGAHVFAFGGTRTFHRMVCAIEDAGFEIREQYMWMYSSGFPKSLNVSKAIDKSLGAERETVGAGKGRTGAKAQPNGGSTFSDDGYQWPGEFAITAPATPEAAKWQGWGTAVKPSFEPICCARKPLDGTVAGNVLKHGTGALNVDACRVGFAGDADLAAAAVGFDGMRARGTGRQSQSIGKESRDGTNTYDPQSVAGRWPPNTLHDGSPEVLAAFARFGESVSSDRERMNRADEQANVAFTKVPGGLRISNGHADSGTAARFFPSLGFGDDDLRFWYGGKAGADDRLASKHPTVKPVALMRWLVRLITPPGGTILDPFAGTGTTGAAAIREGFDAVLIEREPEYVRDIERRLAHIRGDDTPLFASTSPDLFAGAAE
jgi:DNA modification methylase